MSTRAIIAITQVDGTMPILFYRHSDGYPDGVRNSLNEFCRLIRTGALRNNAGQAAGWLVVRGHMNSYATPDSPYGSGQFDEMYSDQMNWKVGSYEPASEAIISGSIEYVHVINVEKGLWDSIKIGDTPELKKLVSAQHKAICEFYPLKHRLDDENAPRDDPRYQELEILENRMEGTFDAFRVKALEAICKTHAELAKRKNPEPLQVVPPTVSLDAPQP